MPKRKNFGASQVTFRRFGKKGWSIFQSLSLNVRIGVLSVATLATAVSEKAHAQQISEPQRTNVETENDMEEVTVAASMAPLTQLQSARIVSVLSRKDIEQAGVQSVNDLLKLVPGVDVRQRGGFGVQTDVSLGGGTFEQVAILLNGVNISNPQTGHLSFDLPVNVSDIERIEVLDGAASRVYGGQAFGGAVNVVTKSKWSDYDCKRDVWGVNVSGEGGSYGTGQGEARVDWEHKNLSMSLSGGGGRSDGGILNDSWHKGNLYYQGQYTFGGSNGSSSLNGINRLKWQFGYSRKSYDANTFYSGLSNDQWELNERFFLSVGGDFVTGKLYLQPTAYWNRTYDNYQWHRGKPYNSSQTDVYGVKFHGWFNWLLGRTAFGAEVREEGILSSSLGKLMDENDWIWGHGAQKQYTKRDDRTSISFNLEHNVLLRRWTVSAGVMANMTTNVDHRFRFYPGVDIAYRPARGLKLYAGYNMAFRLPSFTDLYYNSPDITGNNQLKPERQQSANIGISWQNTQVSLYAKGFYNFGDNMIDYVKESWKDVAHSDNFTRHCVGFQTEEKWDIARTFHLSGMYSGKPFSLSVGYTYLWQKRDSRYTVFTSLYADDYLRHKLVATFVHPIAWKLGATWSVRYQKRMGAYQVYNGLTPTDQLCGYHPYATIDLKLQWTDRKFDVWVKGTNLTNVRYQDLGNIPQPGIWIMAGARLKLNL